MHISVFALLVSVPACVAFTVGPGISTGKLTAIGIPNGVVGKKVNGVMMQQSTSRARSFGPTSHSTIFAKSLGFRGRKLRLSPTIVEEGIQDENRVPISIESSSSLKRTPATQYFKPLVEGDILESTPSQQAVVAASTGMLIAMMVKASWIISASTASFSVALGAICLVLGYEFADFGSGVYHWSMDNYGNKDTPIFGGQIEAFQGHHELPWTITYRQVCNNIYKVCQASSPFCVASLVLVNNPYLLIWLTTGILFINLSQELHKWSHSSPTDTHPIVNALQAANVIVSRKSHLAHHRPPFDGNYCIVSGHCNPVLDSVGFFRLLEKIVYRINGAQARCWTGERLLAERVEELGIKAPRR